MLEGNMTKEQEKEVINLLENAVYVLNEIPNHKYKTLDFHCTYDLAGEIDATLKLLKNDRRKKDRSTI